MNEKIIDFIKENEDLIDNNEWEAVYDKMNDDNGFEYYADIGEFTQMIRSAGIMPEDHLEKIPEGF